MTKGNATLEQVLDLTDSLSPSEQRQLILLLSERLRQAAESKPEPVDMLSLAGLGAELWSQIDVETYVQQERESWER